MTDNFPRVSVYLNRYLKADIYRRLLLAGLFRMKFDQRLKVTKILRLSGVNYSLCFPDLNF